VTLKKMSKRQASSIGEERMEEIEKGMERVKTMQSSSLLGKNFLTKGLLLKVLFDGVRELALLILHMLFLLGVTRLGIYEDRPPLIRTHTKPFNRNYSFAFLWRSLPKLCAEGCLIVSTSRSSLRQQDDQNYLAGIGWYVKVFKRTDFSLLLLQNDQPHELERVTRESGILSEQLDSSIADLDIPGDTCILLI
jgi:hypothetical protein